MPGIPVAGPGPRWTAFVWGWYTLVLGVTLTVAPNLILTTFGIPPTTDPWIRVVGMFVLFIAYQNFGAARSGNVELLRMGVHIRLTVPLFFGAYVALAWMPPVLLLFAAVDVAAALWTQAALKADGHA
jgi:hypothetical protein